MGRRTMKIQLQYPEQSLNGQRLMALRGYFRDDLERVMIQAMWSVLGPLGSSLAELPEKDIQGHLNGSQLLIKGFHQEALDVIGSGEVLPDNSGNSNSDKPEEQHSTVEDEPIQPEQSGDPLNNLF